ncbi:uncharacterized protein MEPE_00209 [Melanopsichium pennsylvanicum]|uniref:Uncharacterized protein n=2 Tax=Melanopsichium pennsylvanicum TaxID=63383 RepID=A0AAJ4XFG7_9BASI|nr:uncharacterized protein BN887_06011 [Melanopsichium pennsylvanicum 4]SNX81504.1 uncharacterized protein MEPE_00209 [Melanopsichium pennsylvanicum]
MTGGAVSTVLGMDGSGVFRTAVQSVADGSKEAGWQCREMKYKAIAIRWLETGNRTNNDNGRALSSQSLRRTATRTVANDGDRGQKESSECDEIVRKRSLDEGH